MPTQGQILNWRMNVVFERPLGNGLDFGVVRKKENHWTKILITVCIFFCMSNRKKYLDIDYANQNSVMERLFILDH